MTWADTAFGASVVVGTVAAVWLAGVAIEAGLWLGTTPRTALAVIVAGVTLTAIGIYLARPLGRLIGVLDPPSEEEVARTIGQRYPEVSDRFVNLLQIAAGRRSNAPEPMIDRAVERLGAEVEEVPFEKVEDFERARKAVRLASLPVVGVLAFLLVAPAALLAAASLCVQAQTTTFTYQGYLTEAGTAAEGAFDFELALYNVDTGGSAIDVNAFDDVAVTGGLFELGAEAARRMRRPPFDALFPEPFVHRWETRWRMEMAGGFEQMRGDIVPHRLQEIRRAYAELGASGRWLDRALSRVLRLALKVTDTRRERNGHG